MYATFSVYSQLQICNVNKTKTSEISVKEKKILKKDKATKKTKSNFLCVDVLKASTDGEKGRKKKKRKKEERMMEKKTTKTEAKKKEKMDDF